MAELERKAALLEVKDIDQRKGIFTGYFSAFGNADSYGDVVDPGAFAKTFKELGPGGSKRIKCAYQHDPFSTLLGRPLLLEERSFGAYHETQISQTSYGKDVLLLIEDGVLTEQSFAYEALQFVAAAKSPDGFRHLKELRVWEYGPVTWGANDQTPITGVKADDIMGRMAKLDKHLKAGDLTDATLAAMMTETLGLWSKAIVGLTAQQPPAERESIVVKAPEAQTQTNPEGVNHLKTKDLELKEAGEGMDACSMMGQCVALMAECQGMMPKALGDQATVNAVMALMGQCMALMVQCQAAMKVEGAAEADSLSFEDRIHYVYQAVRMIERIPYSDGDGDYARYWLAKTYETSCIVEDGKTGKYLSVPWTMGPDGVVLGELTEVTMTWTPAQKAASVATIMRACLMSGKAAPGVLEQKSGARNNVNDAATIRDIHQKAQSLMEKGQLHQSMVEDIGAMDDTDMNTMFGLMDGNLKAKVLSCLTQPAQEPGKSHSTTATAETGADGPGTTHPEANRKSTAARLREIELLEYGGN